MRGRGIERGTNSTYGMRHTAALHGHGRKAEFLRHWQTRMPPETLLFPDSATSVLQALDTFSDGLRVGMAANGKGYDGAHAAVIHKNGGGAQGDGWHG